MAVQDLSQALESITGAVPSLNVDLGYVLALAGMIILMVFLAGLAVLAMVKVTRALLNMTPERFIVTTAVLAGVLIIAGSLLP